MFLIILEKIIYHHSEGHLPEKDRKQHPFKQLHSNYLSVTFVHQFPVSGLRVYLPTSLTTPITLSQSLLIHSHPWAKWATHCVSVVLCRVEKRFNWILLKRLRGSLSIFICGSSLSLCTASFPWWENCPLHGNNKKKNVQIFGNSCCRENKSKK